MASSEFIGNRTIMSERKTKQVSIDQFMLVRAGESVSDTRDEGMTAVRQVIQMLTDFVLSPDLQGGHAEALAGMRKLLIIGHSLLEAAEGAEGAEISKEPKSGSVIPI